ncbi:MAG: hypothetical protein NWE86_03785 [Candidatus Bathyarchaeota archaeon]|nr:hypothetical protein [Candidatus Bathyarchaeota archaeon]
MVIIWLINIKKLLTIKIINNIPNYTPWKQEELDDCLNFQPVGLDEIYETVTNKTDELKKRLEEISKSN